MDLLGTAVTIATALLALVLIVTVIREGLSPVVSVEAVDERVPPAKAGPNGQAGTPAEQGKAPGATTDDPGGGASGAEDKGVPTGDQAKRAATDTSGQTSGSASAIQPGTTEEGRALFEATIRAEFDLFREEGGGRGLQVVESSDSAVELPSILPTTAGWGQLIQILQVLFRRVYTVRVSIEDGGEELFVAATVRCPRGTTVGTRTIRARDYPVLHDDVEASPVQRLEAVATLCAAWAAYALAERLQRRRLSALLCLDWESYGLFRLGAQWHSDRRGQASRAYLAALTKDNENRGAAFNLATLQMVDLCEGPAVQHLVGVIERVQRAAVLRREHHGLDRLWHRASYNAAAAHLHEWQHLDPDTSGDPSCRSGLDPTELLRRAETHAAAALTTATIVQRALRSRGGRRRGDDHDLEGFLEMSRSASLVLLADVWRKCLVGGIDPSAREAVRRVMGHRLKNGETEPKVLIQTLEDRETLASQPPRVRYNLACYYAESHQDQDRAFRELRLGLEGVPAHWALIDPSLKRLREGEMKDVFETLVREHLPPIVLRRFPGAKTIAPALEKVSIYHHSQLMLAAKSPKWDDILSGAKLDETTKLDRAMVAPLVALAELAEVVDRSPAAVRLLYDIHVQAPVALRDPGVANLVREARAMPGYRFVKERLPVWQAVVADRRSETSTRSWTLQPPAA